MKSISLVSVLALIGVLATNPLDGATLKDGTILYPAGSYLAGKPIPVGVDLYGYNYEAHSFAGSYFNSYANAANLPPYNGDDAAYLAQNPQAANHWAWPYRNDQLSMKWNDVWLSNEDKDNDGVLDRHYGFPSYRGSGAWLNNHQSGQYTLNGEEINWFDFVKIVAAPGDAVKGGEITPTVVSSGGQDPNFWYTSSGKEIGPVIWGDFAIIQEVVNDPGADQHGVAYHSPAGPGFGKF